MAEDLNLAAVIIAGGGGTRFWPLSSFERPKQFLQLLGKETLLQQTYRRIGPLVAPERILILTNEKHLTLAKEQLPDLPPGNFIAEPQMRDTAAAIALAAVVCRWLFQDCLMAVLPADHHIPDEQKFCHDLKSAALGARDEDALYTFGIRPNYPATGYGYLERGEAIANQERHFKLKSFKEKPDRQTAQQYVASGKHLWNSGIFVWRAEKILQEIEQHLPTHAQHLYPLAKDWGTRLWSQNLASAFEKLPKISIDFGVMEKAAAVNMVEAQFGWDDVGGWLALEKYLPRDDAGNACRGNTFRLDAVNNLVFCEDKSEKVALIGVKDLVVVRAGNKTLVVPKDRAETIKQLVEQVINKKK